MRNIGLIRPYKYDNCVSTPYGAPVLRSLVFVSFAASVLLASPVEAGVWVHCERSGSDVQERFNEKSRLFKALTSRSQRRLRDVRHSRFLIVRERSGVRKRCKVTFRTSDSPSPTFRPSAPVRSKGSKSTARRKSRFKPSPTKASRLPRGRATLRERMELYQPYIDEAARKYTIPATFIKAVIKVESNFSYRARSSAGALGLMQLMPGTARAMGVKDPFDPRQNIMGGTLFLRKLANRHKGDIVKVLSSYNAGPGAVAKRDGTIPFLGTEKYVRAVLNYYYQYKAEDAP